MLSAQETWDISVILLVHETSSLHSYATYNIRYMCICAPQHNNQQNSHEQAGSIGPPHLVVLALLCDMQAVTKKKEASSSRKSGLQKQKTGLEMRVQDTAGFRV